jgi:hypothetical protein
LLLNHFTLPSSSLITSAPLRETVSGTDRHYTKKGRAVNFGVGEKARQVRD